MTALSSAAHSARHSHLLGFVLVGYVLLLIDASLYPFVGWRWPVEPVWDFLSAPWPRYLSRWEIPLNVAGYVPLGLLAIARVLGRWAMVPGVLLVVSGGAVLSLMLETAQVFIPGRIASNLDWASNVFGTALGAVMGIWLNHRWGVSQRVRQARARYFVQGYFADLTTTVLLVWLFVQISPALSLLGTSEPRAFLALEDAVSYTPGRYLLMEALLTAMNALILLVLLRMLTRSPQASVLGFASLLSAAVICKAIGGLVFLRVPQAWLWLTPGALLGCVMGVAVFFLWERYVGVAGRALGWIAILGAQVGAALLPENPYLELMRQTVTHGHLSNFAGALWWTAQLWPWGALLCLLALHASARQPGWIDESR